MNALKQLVLILLITAAGASATWFFVGTPEKPPLPLCDSNTLKPDEICPMDVPKHAIWVDARSRSEWQKDRVDGAILWNLDPVESQQDFEASFMESGMAKSDATMIVVYCGTEACGTSRQVAERIRVLQMGPEVRVLKGGWNAIRDSNPKP